MCVYAQRACKRVYICMYNCCNVCKRVQCCVRVCVCVCAMAGAPCLLSLQAYAMLCACMCVCYDRCTLPAKFVCGYSSDPSRNHQGRRGEASEREGRSGEVSQGEKSRGDVKEKSGRSGRSQGEKSRGDVKGKSGEVSTRKRLSAYPAMPRLPSQSMQRHDDSRRGTKHAAQQTHITVFRSVSFSVHGRNKTCSPANTASPCLGVNRFDVWEERNILPSNTTLPCF